MRARRYLAKLLVEPLELRESVTVDLNAPAEQVWDVMWDPAQNGLLDPDHELGVTVPGTPPQQVEPGRRAVTRCEGCGHDSGALRVVEPVTDETCRLTQKQWMVLPVGSFARLVEPNRTQLRRGLDDLAATLRTRFG